MSPMLLELILRTGLPLTLTSKGMLRRLDTHVAIM